ncbi:MAG: 7-carboxy-7-deazaguanine synthase QueE [Gammaproteobacteria bacterium]|nr:7-carboxy-7-deazaguanine synthase QueE [Gammaproteobacteria bacterium]
MISNTEPPVAQREPGTSLRITEIFCSLQGESQTVGWPTTFIRLTGCPLRCNYCDTEYAFRGGVAMSIEAIMDRVAGLGVQHVTVTGGEPLAQKPVLQLLAGLADAGYLVSLETSGALAIDGVDERVLVVMDLKTPASGEVDKNRYENIARLKGADEIKFVICNREDYEWACQCMVDHAIVDQCQVLMSPAFGQQDPAQLAQWILDDRLPVRFQLQLHKVLWGSEPGR